MSVPSPKPRVLMVDNYDSFTFNLVHYLRQLDVEVIVKRNDQLTLSHAQDYQPSHIVISPGPCDPDRAGLSMAIIERFKETLPILGVCLGHQAIAQVFGANIIRARQVIHGKTSKIYHANNGLFKDLAQGFNATRYHSLVIDPDTLPECLQVNAWTRTQSGQIEYIMGIEHRYYPLHGIQFHPESVLSQHGMAQLRRFVSI